MTMNTFKINSKYNIKYILKQIGGKLLVLDFLFSPLHGKILNHEHIFRLVNHEFATIPLTSK